MVLVFFVYWFLIFIFSILVILLLSTIRFSIKDLEIENKEFKEEKIEFDNLWKYLNLDFCVTVSLHFLNTIKIFQYTFDKRQAKKLHVGEKIKDLNYKKVRQEVKLDFDREIFNKIKKINFKIKKFKLYLKIGTKSPITTSYLVAIVSIIISIGLANFIKKVNPNNHKYEISPLYVKKNKINLNLDCIIYAKLLHIIYVIFIFLRRRRVKIYEQRTSNRRINDNSNGQYSGYGRCKYNNRRANTNI